MIQCSFACEMLSCIVEALKKFSVWNTSSSSVHRSSVDTVLYEYWVFACEIVFVLPVQAINMYSSWFSCLPRHTGLSYIVCLLHSTSGSRFQVIYSFLVPVFLSCFCVFVSSSIASSNSGDGGLNGVVGRF